MREFRYVLHLLVRVGVYGVWLVVCVLFDFRLFVRVHVLLVCVGKGWRLWCMASLYICIVQLSSLCGISGMYGLCW